VPSAGDCPWRWQGEGPVPIQVDVAFRLRIKIAGKGEETPATRTGWACAPVAREKWWLQTARTHLLVPVRDGDDLFDPHEAGEGIALASLQHGASSKTHPYFGRDCFNEAGSWHSLGA